MSRDRFNRPIDDAIKRQAAEWLARRDRGLSSSEQDKYLQWLQQDMRHGEAVARHETTLQRLMQLGEWQPALSDDPNPDLFSARRRRYSRPLLAGLGLAAAAAVAICGMLWRQTLSPPPIAVQQTYLRVNERQALPDGSLVELKDGSRIAPEFSSAERRVRLIGGEAHFTVAKNPARPFIVESSGVEVRAVGTAFNVRLESASVEVLVTEGTVAVEKARGAVLASESAAILPSPVPDVSSATTDRQSSTSEIERSNSGRLLSAGQRAVVSLAADASELRVTELTRQEIQETLAWQAPRLQFSETPLSVAVAEFNQHAAAGGGKRVVLGDADLGAVRIGGTFRVDNIEGFVRMAEVTLDLRAEPRGPSEIVLTRTR